MTGTARDRERGRQRVLEAAAGEEFTAKDFRTWAGTVLAAHALKQFTEITSKTQAAKDIAQAIKSVAEHLGNTPAVCRKWYVHPAVLDAYLAGALVGAAVAADVAAADRTASPDEIEEAAVLDLLRAAVRATAAA